MATSQSNTPHLPKVGLTTFASYLTATSSERIDCVRAQIKIYAQDYQPSPAFYRDFVAAVLEGRRTGADELMLRRIIAAQHNAARREHYTALANHWLTLRELRLPLAPCAGTIWRSPRLAVSIRPDFALTSTDGSVLVIKLWLKEHPLTDDAARGCLRLLDRHMSAISPGGTPIVVDVRREKAHRLSRRPFKRGFDAWLEAEAEAMATLWERLAA